MRLLLHTCCAPCAIYPRKEAKRENLKIEGLFYNPNIHPRTEYLRRKNEVEKYFCSENLKLHSVEYNDNIFFKATAGNNDTARRCLSCWEMRLSNTASFGAKNKFDAFTTTLLSSPYQDHETLKNICENLSKSEKIRFYYKDFRVGFKEAHRRAREKGIYCQNYCGCVFSLVEREEARKKR